MQSSVLPPHTLDEVRGPLKRIVDEHMFSIPRPVGRGTCRIQVLTGPGAPLVFATQIPGDEGVSCDFVC